MATDGGSATGFGADSGRPRRGQWQIPVFVSGLLALGLVWIIRPILRPGGQASSEQELAQARQALDASPPDPARALGIARRLLEASDLPGRLGEIQFVLGSACEALAKTSADRGGADLWQEARHHLEQAMILGTPESDRPVLMFRLAKAWGRTGSDPGPIIDYLNQAIDQGGGDAAEGYGLLAEAYLRLSPPNVRAALEANQKQLSSLSTADDDALAPAHLLQGELLLRLGEGEEARHALARVHATAPKELYQRARQLTAQSAQRDQLWAEAAPLWEEILQVPGGAGDSTGRVLYDLGLCYARLGRTADAERVWDRALRFDGEIAQAAALGLADLRLHGSDPASALECFERAVRGLHRPDDYHNGLISLAEANESFGRGCRFFEKTHDYQRAQQLAQLHRVLAPIGVADEFSAHVAEAWANDCRERARQTSGAEAERLGQEAAAHLREAALAYDRLARLGPDAQRWLRLSVDRFLQAGATKEAMAGLRRLLESETDPERLGEAWFRLAETSRTAHDEAGARAAYLRCIEYQSPFAFRARLQLALADIAAGKVDAAEAELKQNLDLMRGMADDETYEHCLLTLADLLVRRLNFRMAAFRLQEALERYPNHAGAVQTRLQLADCYRRLAAQEDTKLRAGAYLTEESQAHYREQRRRWLQMAAAHYQKLVDDLTSASGVGAGKADDAALRQAEFALAETRFEMGDFAAAADLYEQIVERRRHEPDALLALKQITRCRWVMRDAKAAADAVRRVRELLPTIPDAALAAHPEVGTRAEWQEWITWAAKQ